MSAFLNKLERKFGRYAIDDLHKKIIFVQIAVFLLKLFRKDGFYERALDQMAWGKVNPLGDFIGAFFTPFSDSIIWVLFSWMIFNLCGATAEQSWGKFRYNLFIFFYGITSLVIFSFLRWQLGDRLGGLQPNSMQLYTGVFLAFATLAPNYTFHLFFVLPVKVKYLAYLSVGFTIYECAGIFQQIPIAALAPAIPLIHYAIFAGPLWAANIKTGQRRKQFEKKMNVTKIDEHGSFHKCKICGITDKESPDMEFRVDDDGNDRCMSHLTD